MKLKQFIFVFLCISTSSLAKESLRLVQNSKDTKVWKSKELLIAVQHKNKGLSRLEMGPQFLEKIKQDKVKFLQKIGLTNWRFNNFTQAKEDDTFRLNFTGSYFDSSKRKVYYKEVHLYTSKNTTQALISSNNKKKILTINVDDYMKRVSE